MRKIMREILTIKSDFNSPSTFLFIKFTGLFNLEMHLQLLKNREIVVLTNALSFTGPKMFWACPNFLCQTKNLFTYCGSHKNIVPEKKMICIQ